MKLAIMQPYLFPYIGYYQLLAAVDKFVFYDDVNFIKNGWINRNRLFLAGEVRYITVPLSGASPFLKINEILIQPGDAWRKRMLESIRHSYAKAPFYADVAQLVSDVLSLPTNHISELAKASITGVASYLGLRPHFEMSSAVYENSQLHGTERIFDICSREHADDYCNLPGGRALYDHEEFRAKKIDLDFIEPMLQPYKQFSPQFQPGLSIIDVLMFNDVETTRAMLRAGVTK